MAFLSHKKLIYQKNCLTEMKNYLIYSLLVYKITTLEEWTLYIRGKYLRPYRYFCKKRNFILLHRIHEQYAVNEKSFFWSFIWVWRQWALHNQCQIWANLNFIKEKKRNIQKIDLLMERPNIGYLCLLFNPYQLISLYACFWIKYFLNLTRPLFDSQKHQQLCKMA